MHERSSKEKSGNAHDQRCEVNLSAGIPGGTHAEVVAAEVDASHERQHPGVRHRAYRAVAARRGRVSSGTREARPKVRVPLNVAADAARRVHPSPAIVRQSPVSAARSLSAPR